jgi:integrase
LLPEHPVPVLLLRANDLCFGATRKPVPLGGASCDQGSIRLSNDDLVISHPDGELMPPIYVSQYWARTVAKTKLARLRFHDLRHAHATHLLASGVHPKIASERLGPSRVSITMHLYSHADVSAPSGVQATRWRAGTYRPSSHDRAGN